MVGVFLNEPDAESLLRVAERARGDGVDAVFVSDGPMGDAIVLAAGLGSVVTGVLLGVRVTLGEHPHRHPTILAREMTSLDQVIDGRGVLAFTGPFSEAVAEAITLCRDMWSDGIAVSDGPYYPVAGAINRPLPKRPGGPLIALDLTDGSVAGEALLAMGDLVLVPTGAAPPAALPGGVEVCQIQER